jgi:DNA-binding transcriptional LysR family regulator
MPKLRFRWAACGPAGNCACRRLRFRPPHVAPLVGEFMLANPEVTVNLDLSDRLVDLLNENIDCAIRIGELTDSSLVSVRLGEMRRMVVASPAYLVAHGVPRAPADLAAHNCLSLGQQRGWVFAILRAARSIRSRSAVPSSATTARCCTNGRWPGGPGLALAVGSRAGSQGGHADLGA